MKSYEEYTKEELLELIKKFKKPRKYGVVWDEEIPSEASSDKINSFIPLLKYNPEKSIIKNEDATNHILIEGDNYDSLVALNYTHHRSIDLIYIDPPYNIGSKDFVYNDDFVDKADTYRHSKWLSFMEKRLKLAKRLLKDDGCIFISINEEEVAQLKMLCDQIFNEKNYLTMFTVKVRHEERILTGDKDFQEVVEYLLMYRKTDKFKPIKIEKDNTSLDDYIYEVEIIDQEPEQVVTWDNKEVEIYNSNQYEVRKIDPSATGLKRYNIRGTLRKSNTSGRFYVKYIEPDYKDKPGFLFKVSGMGDDGIGYRYFLSPPTGRINGDYFQGVPRNRNDVREIPHPNYMDFEKEFNSVGYEGGVDFKNGKKPISFLMKIFELGRLKEKENAVVLDFFAGSGSTANALMVFNEINDGNRQSILCQKDKEVKVNVVSEVTLPRMQNLLNGYIINRKEDVVVEEIKLTKKNIKSAAALMEELEIKQKELEHSGLYNEVKLEIENQSLKLIGSRKKSKVFEGHYANLRYFEQVFIPSDINPDQLKNDVVENCLGLLSLSNDVYEINKKTDSYIILKTNDKIIALYFEIFGTDIELLKEDLSNLVGDISLYVYSADSYGLELVEFNGLAQYIEPVPHRMLGVMQEVKKLND